MKNSIDIGEKAKRNVFTVLIVFSRKNTFKTTILVVV